MKTITLTLVFVLTLSLAFIIDAYQLKQRSNNILREQFLDYLLEAKQQELLNNRIKRYEDQILRRIDYLFDDNESNEDDDDIRTNVRRKAVGLGDNPF